MIPNLDPLDYEILRILVRNARLNTKEIGMKLNRSKSVISERINRMEANGIIKNYIAIADHKKVSSLFISCVLVRVNDHTSQALDLFRNAISDFEEVLECLHITGHFDFYIKVVVENMASYNYFLTEKLGHVSNLAEVKSLPVIDEVKREVRYPVFN
ncbi:Lrp/AsnC family leucine-responsive transcriptional regulator [Pedobacter africanus]|uniref:DNA-binding Lrp family transcriptional regulator n=1 Tax=Pedobacter africanus TaxID=151894 RepID=A0ACC6KR89_9SPHI|nr:Lrp/AsnC family transcriptional regulator [Pedobacter africanus]MDR6781638.1 DNA-binding Lrp family transcriptional regulator [Pedobacter africanus]